MHLSGQGDQGGTAGDGGEAGAVGITLLDKLQTTMHAMLVPVLSSHRMFYVAAFLEDNVRVYHFATLWAEPDWGVVAPVIHVVTPLPSHFDYLPPPKARFGRNWKQNEDPL